MVQVLLLLLMRAEKLNGMRVVQPSLSITMLASPASTPTHKQDHALILILQVQLDHGVTEWQNDV